jgi:hypothetical protein
MGAFSSIFEKNASTVKENSTQKNNIVSKVKENSTPQNKIVSKVKEHIVSKVKERSTPQNKIVSKVKEHIVSKVKERSTPQNNIVSKVKERSTPQIKNTLIEKENTVPEKTTNANKNANKESSTKNLESDVPLYVVNPPKPQIDFTKEEICIQVEMIIEPNKNRITKVGDGGVDNKFVKILLKKPKWNNGIKGDIYDFIYEVSEIIDASTNKIITLEIDSLLIPKIKDLFEVAPSDKIQKYVHIKILETKKKEKNNENYAYSLYFYIERMVDIVKAKYIDNARVPITPQSLIKLNKEESIKQQKVIEFVNEQNMASTLLNLQRYNRLFENFPSQIYNMEYTFEYSKIGISLENKKQIKIEKFESLKIKLNNVFIINCDDITIFCEEYFHPIDKTESEKFPYLDFLNAQNGDTTGYLKIENEKLETIRESFKYIFQVTEKSYKACFDKMQKTSNVEIKVDTYILNYKKINEDEHRNLQSKLLSSTRDLRDLNKKRTTLESMKKLSKDQTKDKEEINVKIGYGEKRLTKLTTDLNDLNKSETIQNHSTTNITNSIFLCAINKQSKVWSGVEIANLNTWYLILSKTPTDKLKNGPNYFILPSLICSKANILNVEYTEIKIEPIKNGLNVNTKTTSPNNARQNVLNNSPSPDKNKNASPNVLNNVNTTKSPSHSQGYNF